MGGSEEGEGRINPSLATPLSGLATAHPSGAPGAGGQGAPERAPRRLAPQVCGAPGPPPWPGPAEVSEICRAHVEPPGTGPQIPPAVREVLRCFDLKKKKNNWN